MTHQGNPENVSQGAGDPPPSAKQQEFRLYHVEKVFKGTGDPSNRPDSRAIAQACAQAMHAHIMALPGHGTELLLEDVARSCCPSHDSTGAMLLTVDDALASIIGSRMEIENPHLCKDWTFRLTSLWATPAVGQTVRYVSGVLNTEILVAPYRQRESPALAKLVAQLAERLDAKMLNYKFIIPGISQPLASSDVLSHEVRLQVDLHLPDGTRVERVQVDPYHHMTPVDIPNNVCCYCKVVGHVRGSCKEAAPCNHCGSTLHSPVRCPAKPKHPVTILGI